jgi:hypothetical protein
LDHPRQPSTATFGSIHVFLQVYVTTFWIQYVVDTFSLNLLHQNMSPMFSFVSHLNKLLPNAIYHDTLLAAFSFLTCRAPRLTVSCLLPRFIGICIVYKYFSNSFFKNFSIPFLTLPSNFIFVMDLHLIYLHHSLFLPFFSPHSLHSFHNISNCMK